MRRWSSFRVIRIGKLPTSRHEILDLFRGSRRSERLDFVALRKSSVELQSGVGASAFRPSALPWLSVQGT
jgi:hypothetical protein